jgi:putative transposase
VTDAEVLEHRRLLKTAKRARHRGVEAMFVAVQQISAKTEQLRSRTATNERPDASQSAAPVGAQLRTHPLVPDQILPRRKKHGPRVIRRRRLTSLPVARGGGTQRVPPTTEREITADEIADDPERTAEWSLRMAVVRAMERGCSARQALEQAGADTSRVRWAQWTYRRWCELATVADGRWARVPKRTVMTPEVEHLVLAIWQGRRRATLKAVWRAVRDEIGRRNNLCTSNAGRLSVPSYPTVWSYIRALPKPVQLVRQSGLAAWDRAARPTHTRDYSEYANHIWQIDHTMLPVWVRTEVSAGEWKAEATWLTLSLDWHSRAVAGFFLSTHAPDAWSTSLTLRHAIWHKPDNVNWPVRGIPDVLVPDRGSDFMSQAVAGYAKTLGITLDPCPPAYPDGKAEIERFFRTLGSYLSTLPGYMPAEGTSEGARAKMLSRLLTRSELLDVLERSINEYHHSPHSGIDGEKPAERWLRAAQVRMPESLASLNVLLLKSDRVRTVGRSGIRFTASNGVGGVYQPTDLQALMSYWRQDVVIRYNPEDLDSIYVYAETSGEFLFEAWRVGSRQEDFDPDRLKNARSEFRRTLKERSVDYHAEAVRDDRRKAKGRDQIRQAATRDPERTGVATTAPATPPRQPTEPPLDPDVSRLVALIERQARGIA